MDAAGLAARGYRGSVANRAVSVGAVGGAGAVGRVVDVGRRAVHVGRAGTGDALDRRRAQPRGHGLAAQARLGPPHLSSRAGVARACPGRRVGADRVVDRLRGLRGLAGIRRLRPVGVPPAVLGSGEIAVAAGVRLLDAVGEPSGIGHAHRRTRPERNAAARRVVDALLLGKGLMTEWRAGVVVVLDRRTHRRHDGASRLPRYAFVVHGPHPSPPRLVGRFRLDDETAPRVLPRFAAPCLVSTGAPLCRETASWRRRYKRPWGSTIRDGSSGSCRRTIPARPDRTPRVAMADFAGGVVSSQAAGRTPDYSVGRPADDGCRDQTTPEL